MKAASGHYQASRPTSGIGTRRPCPERRGRRELGRMPTNRFGATKAKARHSRRVTTPRPLTVTRLVALGHETTAGLQRSSRTLERIPTPTTTLPRSIRVPGWPTCSPASPIIRPRACTSCCHGIGLDPRLWPVQPDRAAPSYVLRRLKPQGTPRGSQEPTEHHWIRGAGRMVTLERPTVLEHDEPG